MPRVSPTLEGFRTAFRRPSLTFAEITWRWVVGATGTALFVFGFFEYLNSLPVTAGEMLFLRTRQPYFVAQAILHILRGSLSRAVLSLLLAVLLLTVLWMIAGSLGRVATVRALLEYFQERFVWDVSPDGAVHLERAERRGTSGSAAISVGPLLSLNFLRAAVAVAAIFGLMGGAILGGFVSPDSHPRPALAFLAFLPVAGLVCLLWWTLNWLLSLAAVFAVRDDQDAVGATAAAVALVRERTGALLAVSSWVGLAHLVVFVAATTAVSMPLAFVPLVPWRVVLLAMIIVTLAYLAVADWLYMARLAGYVCIAEMSEEMFAALSPPAPPAPPLLRTTIDRDELILSDVPTLS